MGKTLRFNSKHAIDHKQEPAELAKTLPKKKRLKKNFLMPHDPSMKQIHGHFSKGMHIWPTTNTKSKGGRKI